MKVLVVDDEPLAQQRIQHILATYETVDEVLLANNGVQAIESCQKNRPDLILMDIRMPAMDGLEAAQHISLMDNAPAIIFVTAYDEYALQAFKVHAVDYLLKPVRPNDLIASIKRCCQPSRVQIAAVKQQINGETPVVRSNIAAKISGNIQLVPVQNILYFLAEQKYVTVKHTHGETVIDETLKELQLEFEESFIRVHRNALVAKKSISGLVKDDNGHTYLTVKGDDRLLEISRRHFSAVKQLLAHC